MQSSNKAANCLLHLEEVSYCHFLWLNIKKESCEYHFYILGFTRQGIEPESTVSVAVDLSMRLLISELNPLLITKFQDVTIFTTCDLDETFKQNA